MENDQENDGNISASSFRVLLCQAIDDSMNFIGPTFPVEVPPTLLVGQLKGVIKTTLHPELEHLAEHRLNLWKLSTPGRIRAQKTDFTRQIKEIDFPDPDSDDALEGNGIVQLLDPAYDISDYWDESPAPKHLHLIVQVPPLPTALSAVAIGQKRKHEDEELCVITKMTAQAPSALANPSEFHKAAKDIVFCNRPFDYTTIPLTLLQEEFAQFEDDCSLPPTPDMAMLVYELTSVCCAIYANEGDRREAVQNVLNSRTELSLDNCSVTPGKAFQTDGHPEPVIMPPFIRECKNEFGCALFEIIGLYTQFVKNAISFRHKTRFPCILMTDIGPVVSIYAAIWDGSKSQVEPLHPTLDFTVHYTDEGKRRTIASVLGAMLRVVNRLRVYYDNLQSASSVPNIKHQFPYRTSYTDRDGSPVNISYTSRINEENLIFIASRPDGTQLCVKFTRAYCSAAHELLAQKNLAPALIAVNDIAGGWTMVVMALSPFIRLDGPVLTTRTSRPIIKAKVAEAVQILHHHDLVHGDIRSTNILVDPDLIEQHENCKLHIIDFDWAGKEGEATYPLLVDNISVRRPKNVVGGGKILKEHDTAMVESLFIIG